MLNFGKWEVEAVWGILTRAVALDGRTEKLAACEEAVMALTIFSTSE
jgi:hypothetical protein